MCSRAWFRDAMRVDQAHVGRLVPPNQDLPGIGQWCAVGVLGTQHQQVGPARVRFEPLVFRFGDCRRCHAVERQYNQGLRG